MYPDKEKRIAGIFPQPHKQRHLQGFISVDAEELVGIVAPSRDELPKISYDADKLADAGFG
eukprot:3288861-Karenia_brevis.AAC.1